MIMGVGSCINKTCRFYFSSGHKVLICVKYFDLFTCIANHKDIRALNESSSSIWYSVKTRKYHIF